MDSETEARENRLRGDAERAGYLLVKSGRRDPQAEDFGLYVLVEDTIGNADHGGQAALSAFANGDGDTLDRIEQQLANLPRDTPR